MSGGGRPLEGVTVVAMEQAVAGPFATPHFAWLNRSKESLALDVKTEHGRDVLAALLAGADVFLHNLAPGAPAALGLDGATLAEKYPRLIVCEISGYGNGGPDDSRRAYDLLIQSEAAVVSVTGTVDEPIKPGIAVADIAAGVYAYTSVLNALLARARTGHGCVIEVSMLDAVAEWMGYAVTVARHGHTPNMVVGMSHPAIAPYDAYPLGDGSKLALSVQNDREWVRLATVVLGDKEVAGYERYAKNESRVATRPEVDALIVQRFATLDFAGATALLDEAGIGWAKINSAADLVEHRQLAARKRWQSVDSPVGEMPTLLPPGVSSAWDIALGPIPALGADNDRILAELGFAPAPAN